MSASLRFRALIVFVTLFAGAKLNIAAPVPAKTEPKTLAYLRGKIGAEPWDLWKTQPLRGRLIALLGKTAWEDLQIRMDPAEPLTNTGGILSTAGNMEHMGTVEEGVLVVDPSRDVAEVLMLRDGKTVRAWAEKNQYIPLPTPVLERIANWPQDALKRALASLQTNPGPAAQNMVQPPAAPLRQGSALDDIQAALGDGGRSKPVAPAGAAKGAFSQTKAKIGAALEVYGLQLGMPATQAQSIVMRLDSRMQATTTDQFVLTDLPGLVLTSGVNYFAGNNRANQSYSLAFTLSPKLASVWGIRRAVNFDEDALPSISATITSLQNKYGPESIREKDDIMLTKSLIWILDADGNGIPRNQAAIISQACAHIGVDAGNSKADVVSGWMSTQIDCSNYSFLNATLSEWQPTRRDSAGRLKPPGLLYSLVEQAMSYPLRRASYEATTLAVDRARNEREQKEKAKASQHAAPI